MRWIGIWTLALALGSGAALAQKPPPAGAPPAPAPSGKMQPTPPPPALNPAPAAPQGDKFSTPPGAAPVAPSPPPAPLPGPPGAKSAAPPPAAPAPQGAPTTPPAPRPEPAPGPQGGKAPPAPSPGPAAPAPAEAAIPANEPATIGRLRTLLGPEARLTYGSAQEIDPASGSARLTEVVITRPGDRRLTMAELTLSGLGEDRVAEARARNVEAGDADATVTLAGLQLLGMTVQRPAAGQDLRPDQLTLDTLRLEGLRVRSRDGSVVALAEASLEEYGTGRTGRLSLAGLDVTPPAGQAVDRVRLGRLAVRGIDLATSMAAMVAQQPPPRPTGRYVMEADTLVVGTDARPMGGMASLRLSGEAVQGGPEVSSLAVRDVRVEPFPMLAPWLRRYGYQALQLDLSAEGRYEPQSGRVTVSSISLAGRDIGALALSFVMDGLTPEAAARHDVAGMRLISAALRYADQSLLQRVLREQARGSRVPEQQLREQYAAMAGGLLTAPGNAPGMEAIRDAVTRFIRGQAQELTVTAEPASPLPFSDMQAGPPTSPAEAQRVFGLGATAR